MRNITFITGFGDYRRIEAIERKLLLKRFKMELDDHERQGKKANGEKVHGENNAQEAEERAREDRCGGMDYRWHYGDADSRNLGLARC